MKKITTQILLLATVGFAFVAQAAGPLGERDRALIESAFNGDLEKVQLLLDKGASVEATAPKNRTALMWAAATGHTAIVEVLHEHGADINAKDSDGQTALMFATSGLYPETVKYLLENGAEVDVQSSKRGFTALMIAASGGHEEIVRLLLKHGADIGIAERNGRTAADRARQYGHSAVVTMLEDSAAAGGDS